MAHGHSYSMSGRLFLRLCLVLCHFSLASLCPVNLHMQPSHLKRPVNQKRLVGNLFSHGAGFENIAAFSFVPQKDETETNQVFIKEKDKGVRQPEQQPGSVWAETSV